MEPNQIEYDEMFNNAKKSTVYAHAMVWIKNAIEEENNDRDQFEEIKKIVDEAVKHLKG